MPGSTLAALKSRLMSWLPARLTPQAGYSSWYQNIFDSAPIGLLLLDEHLKITQANLSASQLLAIKTSELVGRDFPDLFPLEDQASVRARIDGLSESLEDSGEHEQALEKRDGTLVWTRYRVLLQTSAAGKTSGYTVQITDRSAIRSGEQKLERLTHYDSLTDLANRQLFIQRIEDLIKRSVGTEQSAAVLHIDLDQFKRVNDTLGHETGDQLLRIVAQRLSNCVRQEDTVARLGGDEFTLLLENIKSTEVARRVAEKVLESMAEELDLNGRKLVVTPSIGVTLFPADATTAGALLRNADLAMYQAKSLGRNNFQFFAKGMNEKAIARFQTESELLDALRNGEFELYFQPKVNLSDLSVVGAEALLRWHHPTRGTLLPNAFISVAEESGSIVEIGRWVISQACIASREFSEHCGHPVRIAINISARQFSESNLVSDVRRALQREGLSAKHIELEITETMLMADVERSALTLERLRSLGVGLAIDDFGTGYSSFTYLKKFPIHTVKIDRSFVMDIPHNKDDMAISAAVIAMSQALNMSTVAEGVETRDQLAFLQECGCELAQGFLFAAPLQKEKMLPLLTPNLSILGTENGILRT